MSLNCTFEFPTFNSSKHKALANTFLICSAPPSSTLLRLLVGCGTAWAKASAKVVINYGTGKKRVKNWLAEFAYVGKKQYLCAEK